MMKHTKLFLFLLIAALALTITGCGGQEPEETSEESMKKETTAAAAEATLSIDGTPVTVTWEDNEAADALLALIAESPDGTLSIDMERYGGFEQVGPIGADLPADDRRITTSPGDIVLYQGNQMVVFYGSNSWSYTRLGKLDLSPSELTDLLGDHDVTLTLTVAP